METYEYAQLHFGATVTGMETLDEEPDYCCQVMADLVAYSNGVLEACDTPAEWHAAIREPGHVDIRKAIANHKCSQLNFDVAAARAFGESIKNAALKEKWLTAFEQMLAEERA